MKRYLGRWFVQSLFRMVLLAAASSCTRFPVLLPTATPAVVPFQTIAPTTTPEVTRQPTQSNITQTLQPHMGEVERAAQEFFDLVRQGDIDQALSYWDLHEEDARNFKRVAQEWHTQGFTFSVGEVSYSGFVAPGDFRDLEEGDPRATSASVDVMIGEKTYYLMLTQENGAWRMNGLLVRENE